MSGSSNHIFDNLEHGRGRRLSVRKKEQVEAEPGVERRRERRHQRIPFPYLTLAAALKKALAIPIIKKRLSVVEISGGWEELVGEAVSQHVQPLSLEKSILVLQTDSSVWRHQISLMRPEILEKVQRQFGAKVVEQIRVR